MRRFPAEWESQDGVLMAMPHKMSDWCDYLDDALEVYRSIALLILKKERLVMLCQDREEAKRIFGEDENLIIVEVATNDTWARDFAPIFIEEDGEIKGLNFGFNGWGLKFPSNFDNLVNFELEKQAIFRNQLEQKGIVLEGGSIDSNGDGEILTNVQCLLEKNRNPHLDREALEEILLNEFGAEKIHWLQHGYLAGDDTDSHIDTLARFIDTKTIAYIKCEDRDDEHFEELAKMEEELRGLRDKNGDAFTLVPLPFTRAIYYDSERLPASYANFLFINGSLLVPLYGDACDEVALDVFRRHLPEKEVVGVNCEVLIRQHGSLHCVTMHLPQGALRA